MAATQTASLLLFIFFFPSSLCPLSHLWPIPTKQKCAHRPCTLDKRSPNAEQKRFAVRQLNADRGKLTKPKEKKKLFVFFCLSFLTAFMGGVEGIFSGIVSFQLIQTVVSFSEAVSGWESPSMNECTD
ncbi:hypothetical protein M752DRAFT_34210 [Aspergillus phoenicis ATCC 13157]|uniref:Uncharacterized protein n=1 Tax=Aspergillus phoenicis ATCC 13157 TaxID=1353007 RepID=A0A370PEE9_ASPPH|nr:hypothetical protein M752DRAFT_34210 [Aspergillus phoenicis ATCC 13157]